MIPNNHRSALRKVFITFWLFLGWFVQIIPLSAFTAPAEWKFETLQNSSSEWWQTLSVKTVPGVVYHLQKSSTLAASDWTNMASTYGSGSEWFCPVFPGSEPITSQPQAAITLPPSSSTPARFAYLVIEKTTTGGTLISWSSLDNQVSNRMLLPSVTLSPVWDEFDAAYLNHHGNYLFALSPRFHTPVSFTASSPTLGPLDTAMVAGFTEALPAITENMQNSLNMAAQFGNQQVSGGEKAFYRFSADWSVDSDADGRFDWQEIILDGNNPFTSDSDGDGVQDQPQGAAVTGPGVDPVIGLPLPTDAHPATPLATIEQLYSHADWIGSYTPNDPTGRLFQSWGYIQNLPSSTIAAVQSYAELQSAFSSMPQTNDWQGLTDFNFYNTRSAPVTSTVPVDNGSYAKFFGTCQSSFRLHLDAPAPPGGYSIPLRLAKLVETNDPVTFVRSFKNLEPLTLTLEVPEGQMIGPSVDVPNQPPGENEIISLIPASVELTGYNNFDGDTDTTPVNGSDGMCINPAGGIQATFKGLHSELPQGTKILWQKRQLSGGGTMGDWVGMAPAGSNAEPYEGDFVTMVVSQPGIYQLQAVLLFPNGQKVEFPYTRMRNARSIKNGDGIENPLLKAGKPDYFGVARNDRSIFVREEAIKWLGSVKYAVTEQVITDPDTITQPSTIGSPKCNLFVTHLSNRVGATTPYWVRWNFMHAAPIAKDDWYSNPEKHVDLDGPGWSFQGVISDPAPGMVVVIPRTSAGTTHGHVGFLDYDGSWINAGSKTVNKSVHLLDPLPHYRPNNFRSR